MESPKTHKSYRQMRRLADLTQNYLLSGNIKRANDCLAIAEEKLRTGSADMRNAVANGFVFSVTCFLERHRFAIVLPELLEREYVQQINACGV